MGCPRNLGSMVRINEEFHLVTKWYFCWGENHPTDPGSIDPIFLGHPSNGGRSNTPQVCVLLKAPDSRGNDVMMMSESDPFFFVHAKKTLRNLFSLDKSIVDVGPKHPIYQLMLNYSMLLSSSLGIQSPKLRIAMEPKKTLCSGGLCVLQVIGNPNHHLRR